MGLALSAAVALADLWSWINVALASCIFVMLGIASLRWPMKAPAWTGWAGCAVVVSLVLGLGQRAWLPRYHERFGLRRQVEQSAEYEQEERLPIMSYPKRWDSISFYAQRSDVESYTRAEIARLVHDLATHEKALVFIHHDRALADLFKALPQGMEITMQKQSGTSVVVGLVRKCGHVAATGSD
jgi:hypothetical protein